MKKKVQKTSRHTKKTSVRPTTGKYIKFPKSLNELPESYRALIRELAKR